MSDAKIFISHSSKDKDLADKFVDLLITGVGVPNDRIFCTSLEGLGIPKGRDFMAVLKENLYESKLVIFLISENFYSSRFCLCEMGAAWALASRVFPLVVPPLDKNDVRDVFSSLQPGRVGDGSALDNLKDELVKEFGLQTNTPRWNEKRNQFISRTFGVPITGNRILRRGEIIPNIVDAALYVPSINELQEIQSDIVKYINLGKVIPTTYSYISDTGFWNWIRLCEDPGYSYFHDSVNFYANHSRDIADKIVQQIKIKSVDFISLGPGNGRKDLSLLRGFIQEMALGPADIYYYPLDINTNMVESAVSLICRDRAVRSKLKIKAIISDFDNLTSLKPIYRYRATPNIFLLLGNTLGNMKDDREFLGRIYKNALYPGDILILEVKSIANSNYLESMGSLELNKRFDFGPLEVLGIPYDPDMHEYSRTTGRSAIPGTVTTVATYKALTYQFRNYTDVQLSYVHEYNPEELGKILTDIGFTMVERFDKNLFSVFLLQKPAPGSE